jgi:NRPS condensation-like uncharacterized protein
MTMRLRKMVISHRFKLATQDAYNYAASKMFGDQQLCMVLKFDGVLSKSVLKEATGQTLDLEPVLGCRLNENAGEPFWERRMDLNEVELCTVVEAASPEQELQAFINEPVHADEDPLVTLRVFREREVDSVCVKVNHAACDAGGLKQYVALLSNVYSKLCAGQDILVQPNLGRRDQSQIFERTKYPRSLAMKRFPMPTWAFPQEIGSELLHALRTVSEEQLQVIKHYAYDKKVTVNDLLLTALYRTFFLLNNTQEGKPMIMQVSIDLRRYCPNRKAEAICNLSGALYVGLERRNGERFEGTLERVSKAMGKLKEGYPGLESAAGLEYLYSQGYVGLEKYLSESAAMSRKYSVTFPLLSNFGVLSETCFGNLHVTKEYLTSPIMYPPGFMLGVTTFNDEMTLSIGYCGRVNTKRISEFLEAYIEELPK